MPHTNLHHHEFVAPDIRRMSAIDDDHASGTKIKLHPGQGFGPGHRPIKPPVQQDHLIRSGAAGRTVRAPPISVPLPARPAIRRRPNRCSGGGSIGRLTLIARRICDIPAKNQIDIPCARSGIGRVLSAKRGPHLHLPDQPMARAPRPKPRPNQAARLCSRHGVVRVGGMVGDDGLEPPTFSV